MEVRLNLGDPNTEEYAQACDQMLDLLTFLRSRSSIKLTVTVDPPAAGVVEFPAPKPAAPVKSKAKAKPPAEVAPMSDPAPEPTPEPGPFDEPPPAAAAAVNGMTLSEQMEKALGLLRRIYGSEAAGAAPAVKALQKQLQVAKFSDVPADRVPEMYEAAVKLAQQFSISA